MFADGDGGMHAGSCPNRAESSPLNDTTKSLVLVNYFSSIPIKLTACEHNSAALINMLHTCFGAAADRWANFLAVDFYKVSQISFLVSSRFIFSFLSCFVFPIKCCTLSLHIKEKLGILLYGDLEQRSEGGGAFQALDTLNGELLCGCEDVHSCAVSKSYYLAFFSV